MKTRKTPIKTREEWLQAFTREARKVFAKHDYEVPEVRIAVGFTSSGAKGKAIGECWQGEASEDDVVQIFIDPQLGDASRIADVHTHELIHACGIRGHKKDFVDCMKVLGLIGKPTATIAGPEWHKWADPVIAALGPLPHASLAAGGSGAKKQSTRMIKCECVSCGFVFRTSSKWLENGADLGCPDRDCGGSLNIG